jgi:hypothetical protein
MPFDQFGEWIADTTDVNTSADYNDIGTEVEDYDTSTLYPDDPWPLSKD